ncbi:MAG: tripartite tricarboxylate transporter TctB family protein [Gammaproteobacteria bacterium]|uniref:tripartite tricarboxylate transporter TctB family protein n=1 Tax=Limnobacter sp. TaxID=2003368 RepID=UPI001DF1230A|nr:tripartite tricarboxylate transporter TctB family protein [Limnobacter sp.]MBU0784706.1 tripartite tricarboxylate transporter TctB family protein [Gammaproteobacteria bacterium]MBU0848091.1 tripartite tricarboxylate transporter TctB family protein [Gammaproteobacteria bacterium]MBU1267630.1 tripartite tricarboxylate transporter TctB family protein [Gammaproteobacteria bacterium]MBU1529991.1 tripartite tricarboxylate transporter TctB family protein [Gammaproteobacteria bacterium]MBU1779872.1
MPKDLRDFWAGLLYLFIGAAALYMAKDYEMGTAVSMGPGYFPIVLSGLLILIGSISLIRSFIVEGEPLEGFAVSKILYVTVSIVAFALVVEGAGFAIAVILVFAISAMGSKFFNWKFTLGIALASSIFCSLLFVKGLGIPLPIFGSWFGM